MSTVTGDEPNRDQIAYWNGPGGAHWVNRQEDWDLVLAPITASTLARAAVKPGERIVDIGCGCGATTIELARRVAPDGHVLGIDVSAAMLARAAERVGPGSPVELVCADATSYPFPRATFDLLFSRFGVMFFAEPVRAFANLRTALKGGGRLVFVAFRTAKENRWATVPLRAAMEHVPRLPELGPEDPSAFAFASEERVRRILGEAGFRAIGLEPFDLELDIAAGRGLDAAVASALEVGATSRAIDGKPPALRSAVAASIRQALAPYARGREVRLAAALWFVNATSP